MGEAPSHSTPDEYSGFIRSISEELQAVSDELSVGDGERAMDEAGALAGRKAAEDRIAAMKAGKPDKRDSALMKKIKQWSEEGKKIPKHLTVGRMSDD